MQDSASELARFSLLRGWVNNLAFAHGAALPYRSTPPLESSWNQEKNSCGKRYHERTKERPKAMTKRHVLGDHSPSCSTGCRGSPADWRGALDGLRGARAKTGTPK
jgi:hypothetical protein